jgi:hypothetical protein
VFHRNEAFLMRDPDIVRADVGLEVYEGLAATRGWQNGVLYGVRCVGQIAVCMPRESRESGVSRR